MGRKRRHTKKRKKKNLRRTRWATLFSIVAFLYLLGKFGWWAFGFVIAIPIIKYFYKRYTASVTAKSPETPEISSSLTVTYQSQTSSVTSQPPQPRKSSLSTSKEDTEKVAIQFARKFEGRLTPVELSLHTSLSLDEANKALEELVRKGHANITTTEGGTLV